MNREDIIKLAREVGLPAFEYPALISAVDWQRVERFAALVAAAERKALAEQPAQQEPVACKTLCELCVKRGYHFCANAAQTTPIPSPPANKPWVGLTEEDRLDIWKKSSSIDGAINATASKLREKNHG